MLVTLHRPSNVDGPKCCASSSWRSTKSPATRQSSSRSTPARASGSPSPASGRRAHLRLEEPLSYLDFLALEAHAAVVVTDSGGVQEETTFLGVPCLTARPEHRAARNYHRGHEPVGSKPKQRTDLTRSRMP